MSSRRTYGRHARRRRCVLAERRIAFQPRGTLAVEVIEDGLLERAPEGLRERYEAIRYSS